MASKSSQGLLKKRLKQGESVAIALHKEYLDLQKKYRQEVRAQIGLRHHLARREVGGRLLSVHLPAPSMNPMDFPLALQDQYPTMDSFSFSPIAGLPNNFGDMPDLNSFTSQSFGNPFQHHNPHIFGTQPFGTKPFGTQPFGAQPFGTQPFGYGLPEGLPFNFLSLSTPPASGVFDGAPVTPAALAAQSISSVQGGGGNGLVRPLAE